MKITDCELNVCECKDSIIESQCASSIRTSPISPGDLHVAYPGSNIKSCVRDDDIAAGEVQQISGGCGKVGGGKVTDEIGGIAKQLRTDGRNLNAALSLCPEA